MSVVTMKELLEAGVHFGHTTRRWNPKMKEYIYTSRSGIYIIDLKRTVREIDKGYNEMRKIVQNGGRVLFVGTKKQAQEAVKKEAERTGQFYVDQRWLGGTLTNFRTIRRRIQYLKELYEMEEKGIFDKLPKKEVVDLVRTRTRLEKLLGGIKEMRKLPEAVFVVDPNIEYNAIREAKILNIPVFGIVDTNCDPDVVDYVIPANDDAIRAVKLILRIFGDAVIEGQKTASENKRAEMEQRPKQTKSYQTHKPERPKKEIKETKKVTKVEKPTKEQPKKETKEVLKPEKKEVEEVKKEQPVKETKEVKKVEEKKQEESVDLESLRVVDLRKLAKEKGLTGYSGLRKAELIEELKK